MPRHGPPDLLQPVTGIVGLFKGLYALGKALHTIGKVFNALITVLLPFIIILKLLGSFLEILEFLGRPWKFLTVWKTVNQKEPKNISIKTKKKDVKPRNRQVKPPVTNDLKEKIDQQENTRRKPNYLCTTTTATTAEATSTRQTSRPTTAATATTTTITTSRRQTSKPATITTTHIRQVKETEIWYVITHINTRTQFALERICQ